MTAPDSHPRPAPAACPRCRTDNPPSHRFCVECGQALATSCPRCGVAHEPGARFCGGCWRDVSTKPSPPPARLTGSRTLGMRPLEALCHLGLGSLARRVEDGGQAKDRLTVATTLLREMDMRHWLIQAEEALAAL